MTQLVLRVGFSGHRKIDGAVAQSLADAVRSILVEAGRHAAEVAGKYAEVFDARPRIELVTGLAAGADLAAAEAATSIEDDAFEVALVAVSPFDWAEFLRDFQDDAGNRARSEELWARAASRIELLPELQRASKPADGMYEDGASGYEALGRFVVTAADLVIAYYEESRGGHGPGGTGWVLERAKGQGVPRVVLSEDGRGLTYRIEDDADAEDVPQVVQNAVTPPRSYSETRDSARPGLRAATHFVDDYLRIDAERTGLSKNYARLFDRSMGWLGDHAAQLRKRFARGHLHELEVPTGTAPTKPLVPNENLSTAYRTADAGARYYNGLHRTTFALIYLLGFLAVLLAVVGHLRDGSMLVAMLEIVVLAAMLALHQLATRRHWREKGTDFRLLAEILRMSRPLWHLRARMRFSEERAQGSDGAVQRTWMVWYAASVVRSAGTATMRFDAAYLDRARDHLRAELVDDQLGFFASRVRRFGALEAAIEKTVYVLFALAVLGCVSHLMHLAAIEPIALVLTAALPALAAALHGIAGHAELARLETRYEAMHEHLLQQRAALVAMERPTREDLVELTQELGSRMVDEAAEWRWLHAVHDPKL